MAKRIFTIVGMSAGWGSGITIMWPRFAKYATRTVQYLVMDKDRKSFSDNTQIGGYTKKHAEY